MSALELESPAMTGRMLRRLTGVAITTLVAACETGPTPPPAPASAQLHLTALVSAPVTSIVVTVSAADISPSLVFNFPVSNGVATGTITMPVGSDRHLRISAFDAAGAETHRADTTITVQSGSNPPLGVTLTPLTGEQPIIVTISGLRVEVQPTDTSMLVDTTAQFRARAFSESGADITSQVSFTWASTNPSIASVDSRGVVTARVAGHVSIVAVAGGAAGAGTLTVLAPAGAVAAYAGNNQPGLVGYAVNVPPAVRVTNSSGSPVSGQTVTFAVASGGGSVTGAVATTNTSGIAQVGQWVLGAAAGVNTVTATVNGAGIAGNPVAFTDTGYSAGYPITILPYGAGVPATVQTAFDSAVAKWRRLIYRPLSTISLSGVAAGTCGSGTPALSGTTNGLVIYASVDSIDGPKKILAQAGPCLIRSSSGLTVVGVMKFDSADIGGLIADGTLKAVVLHEMGHVIGFGTLWDLPSPPFPAACLQLPSTPPDDIQDTYFSCPKGRAQFDSIGGTSYAGGQKVPVENCGTSPFVFPACTTGTVNGHWRQVVFGNELMVGFLPSNPTLSVVTVAAQEDLGYTVNYAGADPYVLPAKARAVPAAPVLALGDDVRRGPIYVVDEKGRIVRVMNR